MEQLRQIAGHFLLQGHIDQISPLGNGLINDTYLITTSDDTPDYVLQRINHAIFRDVELLQHNIETVTAHIRQKLEAAGAADIERKVLQFIKTSDVHRPTRPSILNTPMMPEKLSDNSKPC